MIQYDVFISYRWLEPDLSWVRDRLAPALKAAGLRICLDVEDFVPGRNVIAEMSRAGVESRCVLCVLSPAYFEGNRAVAFEGLAARGRDPAGLDSHLVPLILRQTDVPDWIRGLIPVDWTKEIHHNREWKKLLKVLNAQRLDSPAPGHYKDGPPMEPAKASRLSEPIRTAVPKETSQMPRTILCTRCGIRPGTRDVCIGQFYEHDFCEFPDGCETIFCVRCGHCPGSVKSVCTGSFYEHEFKQYGVSGERLYCNRCGQHPGEKTICVGQHYAHEFKQM